MPCLKVSSTYFPYCDCKGHHIQYSHSIWDLFLTHFYADFTILILCLECNFFFSFLLCVTAIKNIKFTGYFYCADTMSPCSFSVSVRVPAQNMRPLCGGQLCATVIPSTIICAGAAQCPTEPDCHSGPQHSCLGNPEKHPQSTSNTNQPGWCCTTSWVPWDANLCSQLAPCCSSQCHRQWLSVHTSREKGARCTGLLQEDCSLPGIPRQMAKSLPPPLAPGKISRRKGVVCTFSLVGDLMPASSAV